MPWGPVVLPALLLFWGALAFPVSIQTDGLGLVLGNYFVIEVIPHFVDVVVSGTMIAQCECFFPVAHVHSFPAQPAYEGVFLLVTLGLFFRTFAFLFFSFGVLVCVVFIFSFVLALATSTRGLLGGHV